MIHPFLAESVRQPGESANLHSHGQVLSLDMAGANLTRVGGPMTGTTSVETTPEGE